MFPSSMGCFEEAISPSTTSREGSFWDMVILISSKQALKLSRSSIPSLLDGWVPESSIMFKSKVWQLLLPKKLRRKPKVRTKNCIKQNYATMLSRDAASSFCLEPRRQTQGVQAAQQNPICDIFGTCGWLLFLSVFCCVCLSYQTFFKHVLDVRFEFC